MADVVDRRGFLRKSSMLASAAIIAPSLSGLVACTGELTGPSSTAFDDNGVRLLRHRDRGRDGYGELRPSKDCPEISIPPGFHSVRLSRAHLNEPRTMDDGNLVPLQFDGMGAFAMGGGIVRLVRNHEVRDGVGKAIAKDNAYDDRAPAGTTTLEVEVRPDGSAELKREFVSLCGTFVNCAGGITPWGSWITCEETIATIPSLQPNQPPTNHGYAFEVSASANAPVRAVPLTAMGRFVHEAVAVDPRTGFVYETEDRSEAGFYRFIPNVPAQLALGGTLQMLAVKGRPQYDARENQTIGRVFEVEWVPVEKPDFLNSEVPRGIGPDQYCFKQGYANGGAKFSRLEGCWYGDSGIYFNATSGGNAFAGQIWKYTPTGIDRGELALVFESPSPEVLDSPDNICVSPRGGLVVCEDGAGTNFVRGITRDGRVFDFIRNNINGSEWAGACFSPEGRTLFVNMQGDTSRSSPAMAATYAIWGPWESGAL